MEMYKRAKDRLFGAMYGNDPETAMEAYSIMHKLQKKAFGIWSPFQMEDFLDYPVVPPVPEGAVRLVTIKPQESIQAFGRMKRDQLQPSLGNLRRHVRVVRPVSKVDGSSGSATGEG